MNSKKIILMSLIFILVLCVFSATALADDPIDTLLSTVNQDDVSAGDTSGDGIQAAINTILGITQIAGTGVALIAVSLLGIKYMLASAEDKAEIKKYIVGVVIGGLLVFGGVELAQMLANFTGEVFTTG